MYPSILQSYIEHYNSSRPYAIQLSNSKWRHLTIEETRLKRLEVRQMIEEELSKISDVEKVGGIYE